MTSFLIKASERKSFEEKIGKLSVKTRQNIFAAKNSFERFCNENYDGRSSGDIFVELKTVKGDRQTQAVRDVLQNWIDWMYGKDMLTSAIKQYVSKIRRVFLHHKVKYHVDYFDETLEYKPRIKEELHELTLDEVRRIFKVTPPKKVGFYLALLSTGGRPGELLQVRKKDVDTTQKRIKLRIEAVNVKTQAGRSVWLTREAGGFLMTRLKNLKDDDLVWATNKNASYAEKAEAQMFNKYTEEAELTQRYESNNYRMITLYSFRSFFFGRAADAHREGYAHRMTGHGGYLPQYDRMSDEKKLEWFLKMEPELTISEERRTKIKLEEKETELQEVKGLKQEVAELSTWRKKKEEDEAYEREIHKKQMELQPLLEELINKATKKQLKKCRELAGSSLPLAEIIHLLNPRFPKPEQNENIITAFEKLHALGLR